MTVTRAQIVAEARTWVSTRYAHQGSTKGLGVDCIGLIGGVGVALGLPSALAWARDPAVKGYGATPDPVMLMAAVEKYLTPIATPDAGLGDILILRWETEPHHFAIISNLDPRRVIHAYAAVRKCCETPINGEWRKGIPWSSLIVSVWRYRELID
jgi:NlpC/P60 family putative phage cell wall peptidase